MRKREDWQDILDSWQDDPQAAANHMVLGMNLEQRQARGATGRKGAPTGFNLIGCIQGRKGDRIP